MSIKSGPNIWWHFGLFRKTSLFKVKFRGYFWKILDSFYCIKWHTGFLIDASIIKSDHFCSPNHRSTRCWGATWPMPAITLWSLLQLPGPEQCCSLYLPGRIRRSTSQLSTRMLDQCWLSIQPGLYPAEVSWSLPGILWNRCCVPSDLSPACLQLPTWIQWGSIRQMLVHWTT